MNRARIAGGGLALAVASTLMLTGAADTDDRHRPPGLDISSLAKSERAINNGKTKLVEFKDSHGVRKFYAKVGPRDKVSLRKTSDGSLEIGVKPYDPVTDAEVDEMAAELQAEVLDERRKPLPEQSVVGRS